MTTKLSFNKWLLYYGDDIEYMLKSITDQINHHNLEEKLMNYNIFYDFARIIYTNSYKGRPINNI